MNDEDRARERDRLKSNVEYLLDIPASRLTVGQIIEIELLARCDKQERSLEPEKLQEYADQAEALARKEKGKLWLACYAS